MKPDLIVFTVLQACEVDKHRVKLLHQDGPFAPETFEVGHVIRQTVARSDKSFERVLRNLEFLQIDAQRLLKFLDRVVELDDPPLFNLGALRNIRLHRGDGGIGPQNLVIVAHARCPHRFPTNQPAANFRAAWRGCQTILVKGSLLEHPTLVQSLVETVIREMRSVSRFGLDSPKG
jgi:hypothetical protein